MARIYPTALAWGGGAHPGWPSAAPPVPAPHCRARCKLLPVLCALFSHSPERITLIAAAPLVWPHAFHINACTHTLNRSPPQGYTQPYLPVPSPPHPAPMRLERSCTHPRHQPTTHAVACATHHPHHRGQVQVAAHAVAPTGSYIGFGQINWTTPR